LTGVLASPKQTAPGGRAKRTNSKSTRRHPHPHKLHTKRCDAPQPGDAVVRRRAVRAVAAAVEVVPVEVALAHARGHERDDIRVRTKRDDICVRTKRDDIRVRTKRDDIRARTKRDDVRMRTQERRHMFVTRRRSGFASPRSSSEARRIRRLQHTRCRSPTNTHQGRDGVRRTLEARQQQQRHPFRARAARSYDK
jgi:hypothetical protein